MLTVGPVVSIRDVSTVFVLVVQHLANLIQRLLICSLVRYRFVLILRLKKRCIFLNGRWNFRKIFTKGVSALKRIRANNWSFGKQFCCLPVFSTACDDKDIVVEVFKQFLREITSTQWVSKARKYLYVVFRMPKHESWTYRCPQFHFFPHPPNISTVMYFCNRFAYISLFAELPQCEQTSSASLVFPRAISV